MSTTKGDGVIVLKTQVDTTGVQKGMNTMKNGCNSLNQTLSVVKKTIAAVFSAKILNDWSDAASKTEASIIRLTDLYGKASESVGDFIDQNAKALGMSKSAAASYAAVYGNLFSVWADQATNAKLTNQYLNMTSVVATKTGRTVSDVQERIRSGLLGNTEAIEDLGIFVNIKTIEMTDAFKRLADGRSWDQLGAYEQQQVRTLAIMEQATKKYGTTVEQTSTLVKSQFGATFEDLKNTLGQLVNTVLIPAMQALTWLFSSLNSALISMFGLSEKTVETTENIASSVTNQNSLTDAVKETAAAQEKALAGFDKLNILQTKNKNNSNGSSANGATANIAGGSGILSEISNEINGAETEITGLQKTWENFFYETVGNISVRSVQNLDNAMLKASTSAKKWLAAMSGEINLDLSQITADLANFNIDTTTGLLTMLSGYMDVGTGISTSDGKTAWSGLGKFIQGVMINNIAGAELVGMEEYLGYPLEDLKQLFYPVTEEVENLYKGLSTAQAKALEEFKDSFGDARAEVDQVIWGGSIVSAEDTKAVKSSLNNLSKTVTAQCKKSKSEALKSLRDLKEKGLLTEDEYAASISTLEDTYDKQTKIISENQSRINEILENASKNKRALTQKEREEIEGLMERSTNTVTDVIRNGASTESDIRKQLAAETEQISASRLSQIIQYANSEYEESVKAAEDKYNATVENANKLYYETGVISKAQYDEIVGNAKKTRDEELKQAQNSRKELVKEAQKKAGDIADTVDPETGEILSNWEKTWNSAYSTVKKVFNSIITIFNRMIKGVFGVSFKGFNLLGINTANINIPQLPLLAKGGIVPHRTAAIIGEAGKEAVLPLENNTEWMDVLAAKINNGKNNLTIQATGSMAQLIRLLRLQIVDENDRASVF